MKFWFAIFSMEREQAGDEIVFQCEGHVSEKVAISDYDLCTIFSNLLSNAREACKRLQRKEKRIEILMKEYQKQMLVTIKNPIEWEVDMEKLGTYTSEEDGEVHGYGIIVGMAVEIVKWWKISDECESILVICQELFEKDFDMFFRKKVTLIDLRYVLHKTECQFDSILCSVSSFSPVYSWFLTSNPKTSRTNLRDVENILTTDFICREYCASRSRF